MAKNDMTHKKLAAHKQPLGIAAHPEPLGLPVHKIPLMVGAPADYSLILSFLYAPLQLYIPVLDISL